MMREANCCATCVNCVYEEGAVFKYRCKLNRRIVECFNICDLFKLGRPHFIPTMYEEDEE